MVQPSGDGLQRIRDGIDESRGRQWWKSPAVALVAAAALGVAAGGLWFAQRDDDNVFTGTPGDLTSQSPSPTPSPTDSAPSASQSPSGSESAGAAKVYVYYVHGEPQGLRLYREQHSVAGNGSPGELAVQRMLAGQPDDPDYETPWDNSQLLSYEVSGDTAVVNVDRAPRVTADTAQVIAQELVYTVTANDKSVQRVRVLVDGSEPSSQELAGPSVRAPMVDVQGLIWLLSPTQGETVGSPVTINGYGTAFEATISWEVRKDGEVVKDGFTSGGSNGEFDEFTDTVDLPPGDYEIAAFESSAEDGSPIHIDTKNFTVR
jgi:hypothetical protein